MTETASDDDASPIRSSPAVAARLAARRAVCGQYEVIMSVSGKSERRPTSTRQVRLAIDRPDVPSLPQAWSSVLSAENTTASSAPAALRLRFSDHYRR